MPKKLNVEKLKILIAIVLIAVLIVGVAVGLGLESRNTSSDTPGEVSSITVRINEVVSSNSTVIADADGDFCDYVELYNYGETDVSLSGYAISDEIGNIKHTFSSTYIKAGEYLILYCNNKNTGGVNMPFALTSSGGEDICIYDLGQNIISQVRTVALEKNKAMLYVDGEYVVGNPSPGYSNDALGEEKFELTKIDENITLAINEIVTENFTLVKNCGSSDLIELVNKTNKDLSLDGYYITDNKDNPTKFALPNISLKSGEVLLVYADGKGVYEDGKVHASFSLSYGETLYVITPQNKFSDSVMLMSTETNQSMIRLESGEDVSFIVSDEPTPGYENTAEGRAEFLKSTRNAGLEISEAVINNTKYLPGPYGACYSLVEIFNNSDGDINLSGYYLSDSTSNLKKAALPNVTIKAGEYLVFICDENAANANKDYAVLPINISKSGEDLVLSYEDTAIDYVYIPALAADVAYGRANGQNDFGYLKEFTPQKKNSESAGKSPSAPKASSAAGAYDGVSSLKISLSGEGKIYYTTDCTIPTADSKVYTGELTLTETTVIRARCYVDGSLPGEILTATYVINEGHTMDVVSLVTEPENLWNEKDGIYVFGAGASSTFPHKGANFWQDWEKEAVVSLYADGEQGFTVPCGLKIFGAYSRGLDKKSFVCYMRSQYGASSLEYKLFDDLSIDNYESFVLRQSGQDWQKGLMRDVLQTSLVAEYTTVDVQAYRPVVLYLNGEYWGIYYIREKLNENYVAAHYNVTKDSVQLCKANGTTDKEYTEFIKWVESHDLSKKENYEYVASKIDIDNYIDYIVAELYCANPDNGNIRFFKSDMYDGKWRWIMYDMDYGYDYAAHKTVEEHFNIKGTGSSDAFSTSLIMGLLKNEGFKEKLLKRLAWQYKNIWAEEIVMARVAEIRDIISEEVKRDCERWKWSYSTWEKNLSNIEYYTKNRQSNLTKQIKSFFGLSDSELAALGF